MPKRSRSQAVTKSRSKKRKYQRTVSLPKNFGFEASRRVTMTYSQNHTLSDGTVGLASKIYRGASIYDPDYDAVGHQPLGHDQWANLYQRYRVIGSKITVHYGNRSTAESVAYPLQIAVIATDSSTLLSDFDTVCEQPIRKVAIAGSINGGNSVGTISLPYITTEQIKGDKGAKYDKDYAAVFGANPSIEWWYHIYVSAPVSASVTASVRVTIDYDVLLYTPIQLTES